MSEQQTKEEKKVSEEVIDKVSTLIISAFGLVAALAWNDAIKSIFDHYFPSPQGHIWAQLGYATVITILVVIITINLTRTLKKIRSVLTHKE